MIDTLIQSPCRLAELAEESDNLARCISTLERWATRCMIAPSQSVFDAMAVATQVQYQLDQERRRVRVHRYFAQRETRDSWERVIVLTPEVSAALINMDPGMDDLDGYTDQDKAVAQVYGSMGFDPSPTELGDYSPTGMPYQRAMTWTVMGNCVVISQMGGLDV